jgi:hypothetical protein
VIPCDPADLNDSAKEGYWSEVEDLKPFLDYWGPRLVTMTQKQFQDLLVTIFWIGKED